MNKLTKSAKLLSTLLNLLFWFLLVRSALLGIMYLQSLASLFLEPEQGTMYLTGITLDYLSITAENGIVIDRVHARIYTFITCVICLVQTPLFCYGIQLLRKVLRSAANQRPFSGAASILRRMGWVSTALAVISNATHWGLIYLFEHGYQMADLLVGDTITSVAFHYEPDWTFVLTAVVLFLMCWVFRYGEELQQLSDETL